jgi:recombination protein RecT
MTVTNNETIARAQEMALQKPAVQKDGPKTFEQLMTVMKTQISRALPAHLSVERMTRIAMTAYNSNPKLKECTALSVMAAVMTGCQLGLEMNTPLGLAYIIPYKGAAEFQIGYQGILELCYRTGLYKRISAHEVYSDDMFEYELGLNQRLRHIPSDTPTGEPIRYYAVYETKDGGTGIFVASKEQVMTHAKKYSKSYNSGPWVTNFPAMAKKTCLIALLNTAPKSIEITKSIVQDNSIRSNIDIDMSDVPNEQIEADNQ